MFHVLVFSHMHGHPCSCKLPFMLQQVSMFKRNYDHLPKDVYFGNYREAARGNPNYFLTYGNGKAAARIQDHLRPNGAHRWHNYMKSPKYGHISKSLICSFIHYLLMELVIFSVHFSTNILLILICCELNRSSHM